MKRFETAVLIFRTQNLNFYHKRKHHHRHHHHPETSLAKLQMLQFNPFVPNAPFLYPLKTSENRNASK